MKTSLITLPLYFLLLLLVACASVGNPGGGPRDEDPPRFVGSSPRPYSVNVTPSRVVITFDEVVNVKDAFSKVAVSPVSKSMPRVSSQGRRVTVEFQDTLLPNTTYTIDFGDAIEDNNEANKLHGFSFSFSTGEVLDSLRVSGMVLGAADLEPQQGMLVGIQSQLADSAFSTLPLERVARTDDRGRFIIRGLKPGSYRLFALGDTDNDFTHANPEESMAFLSSLVVPSSMPVTVTDTIWNLKTGVADTVVTREATRFLPDDILLRSFDPDAAHLYLLRHERPDSARLQIIMSRHSPELPSLSFPDYPDLNDTDAWCIPEHSPANDTLTYWLRDPRLVANDTLQVALSYLRTDSLHALSPLTDTLRFLTPRPRPGAKAPKKTKEQLAKDSLARLFMEIKMLGGLQQEVNRPLYLEFTTPPARLDTAAFRLEMKQDTTWIPARLPMRMVPVNQHNPRRFAIEYPWAYDTEYRLVADTLAATGINGLVTRPLSHSFHTKKEDEYCSLTLSLTGWPEDVPAFVQLLNASDTPVRTEPVVHGRAIFPFLTPGKYYARITEDLDGDGRYTTGDYDSLRQPERTFYYPKAFNVKKNWDRTESWDIFATPIDRQKPRQLLKNQPEADKRAKETPEPEEEEEED